MRHARSKNKLANGKKWKQATARERIEARHAAIMEEEAAKQKAIARKASEKKKKKPGEKSIFWAKVRVAVIILVCIMVVVGLGVGAGMYAAVSREIDDLDFEGIAYNFSSIVYANDADGNAIEIEHLHNDGNREWIDPEMIPDVARDAAVSIEDERFYKHKGVDIKRTTGAVIGWFASKIAGKSPTYGGSTITQQVIKNITQEKDKTVTRKVKEMMRAIAFERRFTKDEILSTYLNIAYFGNQCYGIEAASKMYFSKNAIDLTLPEAAMIVGITQAPTRYDPFRNPESSKEKRDIVLMKMYELGKITEDEYNEAVNSGLGVNEGRRSLGGLIYSYFVDQVINDVIADLQNEKGYSQTFASQQIFGGGLKIYTTMDPTIQDAIESVYENKANFGGAQSAMVIMDPYTGEIKGIAGGVGVKTESRGLNRATQSRRQAGSSVKPLSVYAPALENKKITAATIITDSPLTIGDWSPKNSYKGFKGDMSVRRAIEISANIPAVKTLQTLGVDTSFKFMTQKLGFTSLTENDKNLSALGLGGMSQGVSAKEMAAAYAIFPNKGVYITPYTYTKVLDSSGKVLLEKKPESTRAISEANAFIMTSFLKDVVNGSAGTGRNARLAGMATYGKTGTSNDNKDKWFCGFTPYYVGAVWYGYDSEKSVGSTNIATQVWKKVMEKVHNGMPEKEIEQPDSVTAVSVCQVTGKLSSSGCKHAKTEYFAKGTLPTKYCENNHSKVVGATSGTGDGASSNTPEQTTAPEKTGAPETAEGENSGDEGVITVPTEPTAPPTEPEKTPENAPKPTPNVSDEGIITLE